MKVIRFLTTVIIFQLIGFGAQAKSQEIAEFEIRNPTPATPFPAHVLPLDNNGHILPSNQCKNNATFYQTNRCGFSAGLDDDVVENQNQQARSSENEIDLSPLSFQCMESGCEFEYANSAREFRANLQAIEKRNETLARAEARKIIEAVFANSPHLDENVEVEFDEYEFIPYFDPAKQLGLDPVTPSLTISSIEDYRMLSQFWLETISKNDLFHQPLEFVNDQMIELECRLCGSPVLSLLYGFQASIEDAQDEIARKKEIIEVQKNAMILQGFASLTKMMGESLIKISDSIVRISTKKVESLSSSAKKSVR